MNFFIFLLLSCFFFLYSKCSKSTSEINFNDFYLNLSETVFSCSSNYKISYLDSNLKSLTTGQGEKIIFSPSLKSTHQKLELFSKEWKIYMDNLWKLLELVSVLLERNNVLYSLQGGSIIGFYRDGEQLFFDDDIDLIVREKDFEIFERIWESGENERIDFFSLNINSTTDLVFVVRDVIVFGNEIEILKPKKVEFNGWYKLRFKYTESEKEFLIDSGGIDIDRCKWNNEINRCTDTYGLLFWYREEDKAINFPPPTAKIEDYPMVDLCGVKTRIIKKELLFPWFDEKYEFWKIRMGPIALKDFLIKKEKLKFKLQVSSFIIWIELLLFLLFFLFYFC